MDFPKIKTQIEDVLSRYGEVDSKDSKKFIKKTQHLFQNLVDEIEDSEDPQEIEGLIKLLDKVRMNPKKMDLRCLFIFMNTIDIASKKLELLTVQKSPEIKITLKHRDLVGLILVLYPDACKKGICHGVALMGAQAILAEAFDKFKRRLERLSLIVDKYPGNPGKKDYTVIMQEIKECSLDEKNDFISFFEGLHICMEGYRYQYLFPLESEIIDQLSKKFKTSAIALIASKELEERGEVVEVENASFCGSYTYSDLGDYFNSLEEIFLQGLGVQTPIVFILENEKHTIVVGYDFLKKKRFLVNGNQFQKMEFSDIQELVDGVALSFKGRVFAFSTRILITNSTENSKVKYWERKLIDWQNSQKFQAIHAFIPEAEKNPSWLKIAARNGNLRVVKALLTVGTKVTEEDSLDSFFLALEAGHLDVVRAIVASLGSVDDLDLLQRILNKQKKDGSTTLMYASQDGCLEAVRAIISCLGRGKDSDLLSELINKQSSNGSTALMMASKKGYFEIAETLLAALKGKPLNLAKCLNKQRFDGLTALMRASQDGDFKTVEVILSSLKDVRDLSITLDVLNKEDPGGKTVFMLASYRGHFEIVRSILDLLQDVKNPHLLLEVVNKEGLKGMTGFLWASQEGKSSIVKNVLDCLIAFKDPHLLLQVVNKSDSRGVTALMMASYLGRLEIVKDILSSARDLGGPDLLREIINKKRENGSTALMLAQKQGHLEVVKIIKSFTI